MIDTVYPQVVHELAPELSKALDALAEHRARRLALSSRSARLMDEFNEAMQAWPQERRAALMSGEAPPSPPEQPTEILTGRDAGALLAEETRLENQVRDILAMHDEQLVAALRRAERAVLDGIRARIGSLDQEVSELARLGEGLGAVIRAHNNRVSAGAIAGDRWAVPTAAVDEHALLTALADAGACAIR